MAPFAIISTTESATPHSSSWRFFFNAAYSSLVFIYYYYYFHFIAALLHEKQFSFPSSKHIVESEQFVFFFERSRKRSFFSKVDRPCERKWSDCEISKRKWRSKAGDELGQFSVSLMVWKWLCWSNHYLSFCESWLEFVSLAGHFSSSCNNLLFGAGKTLIQKYIYVRNSIIIHECLYSDNVVAHNFGLAFRWSELFIFHLC